MTTQDKVTELIARSAMTFYMRTEIIIRGLSIGGHLESAHIGESCAVFKQSIPREDWGFVLRTSEGWELHRYVRQSEDQTTYHKDARAFIA